MAGLPLSFLEWRMRHVFLRKGIEIVHFSGFQGGVKTQKNSWMEKRWNWSSFGKGKIFGAQEEGVDPYHRDAVDNWIQISPLFS